MKQANVFKYLLLQVFFLVGHAMLGQPGTSKYNLSGVISDESGESLPGAYIMIEEAFRGSFSDETGYFEINNLEEGSYTVLVSYTGYEWKEVQIELFSPIELDINLVRNNFLLDAVAISASRGDLRSPIAYSELHGEDLQKANDGQDMPFFLQMTPSAVVTSDAGAGVGYTGIRIRGSDPTRTNVTINGIPLNDSESQAVFWVDLPDFVSSVEDLQIQRGVGTSSNGAGAFGASINVQTKNPGNEAYGILRNSYGSFNTHLHSLRFGTGVIKDRWSVDGRASWIQSDGYIDRATADLKSFFGSIHHIGASNSFEVLVLHGEEVTYQAWGGVPVQYVDIDSLRTFNPYTYEQEVDDYRQTHAQLLYDQMLNKQLLLKLALHYTKGKGFFEQFREDDDFNTYGIQPAVINGDTVSSGDVIRRRWLDNDFYGGLVQLNWRKSDQLEINTGGALHRYIGDHFGEVIWAEYAGNTDIRDRYYDDKADKDDYNVFVRTDYRPQPNLNVFLDLQYRGIAYDFTGNDSEGNELPSSVSHHFFNPKAGLTWFLSDHSDVYAYFGIANKEPGRDDYTESTSLSSPLPEQLYDYEAGYRFSGNKARLAFNFYYMDYKNQLAATGELNDVGAITRTNIPSSYRAGLEVEANWHIAEGLTLSGNATYSQNKIKSFTEYVDNWDTGFQEPDIHENTDMAYSPSLISAALVAWKPLKTAKKSDKHDLTLSLEGKFVGKQFIDNTSSDNRSLDAYAVANLRINHHWQLSQTTEMQFFLAIKNLLDAGYSANAWVYRFRSPSYNPVPDDPYVAADEGDFYNMIGLFPQAGIHFSGGVQLQF